MNLSERILELEKYIELQEKYGVTKRLLNAEAELRSLKLQRILDNPNADCTVIDEAVDSSIIPEIIDGEIIEDTADEF